MNRALTMILPGARMAIRRTSLRFFLVICSSTGLIAFGAPIQNARATSVRINGNCEMCEETIEEAVPDDGLALVDWDRMTGVAMITNNSTRTRVYAVLERIARAGYDNERYTAPDTAYKNLPHCCRYRRSGTDILPPGPGEGMN